VVVVGYAKGWWNSKWWDVYTLGLRETSRKAKLKDLLFEDTRRKCRAKEKEYPPGSNNSRSETVVQGGPGSSFRTNY
jgi:hypothetical protein